MPIFEVQLQFSVTGNSPNDHIKPFLSLAPYLWKELCKRDIQFTVLECTQPTETDLSLRLLVTPRYEETSVNDTVMRSVGIKYPSKTRAFTDLYFWILSLRRWGEGPIYAAWRAYCDQRDIIQLNESMEPPVQLLLYNYRDVTPIEPEDLDETASVDTVLDDTASVDTVPEDLETESTETFPAGQLKLETTNAETSLSFPAGQLKLDPSPPLVRIVYDVTPQTST